MNGTSGTTGGPRGRREGATAAESYVPAGGNDVDGSWVSVQVGRTTREARRGGRYRKARVSVEGGPWCEGVLFLGSTTFRGTFDAATADGDVLGLDVRTSFAPSGEPSGNAFAMRSKTASSMIRVNPRARWESLEARVEAEARAMAEADATSPDGRRRR